LAAALAAAVVERAETCVGALPSCLFAGHPLDLAVGELAGWY